MGKPNRKRIPTNWDLIYKWMTPAKLKAEATRRGFTFLQLLKEYEFYIDQEIARRQQCPPNEQS